MDTTRLAQVFIGVDPGSSGAIAFLDAGSSVLCTVRTPESAVDLGISLRCAIEQARSAAEFILTKRAEGTTYTTYIENVSAMPGQGVSSMFTFGRFYGRVEGALAMHGLVPNYVVPRVWQKALGIIFEKGTEQKVRKKRLVAEAMQLWPNATISSGIADALLIAEYGRRQCLQLQLGTKEQHGEEGEGGEGEATQDPERSPAAGDGEHAPSAARAAREAGRRDPKGTRRRRR